jgi:hypothetical protein
VNPPALSSVVAPIVVAAGLSFWWVFRQRSRRPERATTSASPAETPVDMNEEAFLSKLSDAVLIAGRDGIIANASRGAERVLGGRSITSARVVSEPHPRRLRGRGVAGAGTCRGRRGVAPPQRWRVRRADGSWFEAEYGHAPADAPVDRCVIAARGAGTRRLDGEQRRIA